MKTVLKSKLHEIKITAANKDYEGSLTLDVELMESLCVDEYEQVFVHSKDGKGRIMTYFVPGERGSRCCELNGGAANHFAVGETVHLLIFTIVHDIEIVKPIIVKL